jgi:BirA family biotin operon repressor/biotin-[acetyl-CoA-carboxylase] ligase
VVTRSTASTNDDAKRAAHAGAPEGAAFVADTQTSGRGRLGRVWHSPPGENLYASFVLRPGLSASSAQLVTFAAGLAVVDAVANLVTPPAHSRSAEKTEVGAPRVLLKWPNDVLVDGRKLAGILCEAHWAGGRVSWIVVGVGINVRTTEFPEELRARATSLALAGAVAPDRGEIFVDLAASLAARVAKLTHGDSRDVVRDFAALDALAGRTIVVDGSEALALGIADDGSLRIRRRDGTESTCAAGEVQLQEPQLNSGG